MEPFGVTSYQLAISFCIAFSHSHDEQSIVVGLLPAVRVRHFGPILVSLTVTATPAFRTAHQLVPAEQPVLVLVHQREP